MNITNYTARDSSNIINEILNYRRDFLGNNGVTAEKSFPGYNGEDNIVGKVEYAIFYNSNNYQKILKKPIVILDGYDPGDKRKLYPYAPGYDADSESLLELAKYNGENNNLVKDLTDKGYEVILVNFLEGADYIERNALAVVKLIKKINEELKSNGSQEKLVMVGPSMGGLISRYALAYMEKKEVETNDASWNHNTRLWVSFDSPHLGANIPLSSQYLLYFLGYRAKLEKAKYKFGDNFRSNAARQMLIEQLDWRHEASLPECGDKICYSVPNLPDISVEPTIYCTINKNCYNDNLWYESTYGQNNNAPFRKRFINNLKSNGLPGSSGFPQNLEKIAISNGTLDGTTTNQNNQMALRYKAFFFGNVMDLQLQLMPKYGEEKQFLYAKVKKEGKPTNGRITTRVKAQNINSSGNMDIVQGGTYNTFDILKEEFTKAIRDAFGGGLVRIETRANLHKHSFIPTYSSLAIKNTHNTWDKPIDENLVCANKTPFDNYFSAKTNEDHVHVSEELVDWLMIELETNDNDIMINPCLGTEIKGDEIILDLSNHTYEILNFHSGTQVEWVLPNNLIKVNAFGNRITLKQNPSSNISEKQAIIKAYLKNGNSVYILEKVVSLGLKPVIDDISINMTPVLCTNLYSNGGQLDWTRNLAFIDLYSLNNIEFPVIFEWKKIEGFDIIDNSGQGEMSSVLFKPTMGIQNQTYKRVSTQVRARNQYGWSEWSMPLYASLKDCSHGYYSVYPNPAHDVLNISFTESETHKNLRTFSIKTLDKKFNKYIIKIYNTAGIEVRSLMGGQKEIKVPLNGLLPGNYFLHIIKDGKTHIENLMIK